MKTGQELIWDMRNGKFSIDEFSNSYRTGVVMPVHVAVLIGTSEVMGVDKRGRPISGAVTPENLLANAPNYGTRAYRPPTTDSDSADDLVFGAIITKAQGMPLSEESITNLVADYVSGRLSDTHMAAFLGAIMVKGLDTIETTTLTRVMADSGGRLTFPSLDNRGLVAVDKHSTGGIGDGTSLVIAPLVAAACQQVYIPMMSGRALGHTGGTLDKLEAIPGLRVDFTPSELEAILAETRCAIFGQTDDFAPADKKIYALRDVTACVANDGLIVASILSKKLAAGVNVLVQDAKYGNGAFLNDYQDCRNFAQLIVNVATANGLRARAMTTDMNEPLGLYAGNKLEVAWAEECLNGFHFNSRFMFVTYELAVQILTQSFPNLSFSRYDLAKFITGGDAYSTFRSMVRAQGGNVDFLDEFGRLRSDGSSEQSLLQLAHVRDDQAIFRRLRPTGDLHCHYITSPEYGYIDYFEMKQLGNAIHTLGDSTNPDVGIIFTKARGHFVKKDEVIAVVLHDGKTGNPEIFKDYIHIGTGNNEPDESLFRELITPTLA